MELLFKAYAEKRARLGIKYAYMHQAGKEYEAITAKCSGHKFRSQLEIVNSKMQLVLISEQNAAKFIYKNLEFKPDVLKKLILCLNSKEAIEFVHVYMEGNQPIIAKAFKRTEFITISSLELIGAAYFDGVM